MSKTFLMCKPTFYEVGYEINPWMTSNIGKVDTMKALEQWYQLRETIEKCGGKVKLIDQVEGLPDMVFTANAGFKGPDKKVIVSNFMKPERQRESLHFFQWFLNNGYEPSFHYPEPYEGEGDHLYDKYHDAHWVGTGFRSKVTHNYHKRMGLEAFLDREIYPLNLIDPRWYHLDTCFCPLPRGELLYHKNAFDDKSLIYVDNVFYKKIDISAKDALMFSCNSIVIGNNVIMPLNYDACEAVKAYDYDVTMVNMSEFLKAGGAAKCLVMTL